jgi:hypothetical protein
MPETGSVHVVMGLLSSMVSFDSKIVTSCDELLVDITSRFFDSFRVLVRLTRVVLTLVCAYVEIWTDMALRIASDDLRWAEKKQNHGVMTTGRRADSERATAIKPNHDVCLHIASYFQEIGYVFCRAKLGMYRELLKYLLLRGIARDLKPLAAVACKATGSKKLWIHCCVHSEFLRDGWTRSDVQVMEMR